MIISPLKAYYFYKACIWREVLSLPQRAKRWLFRHYQDNFLVYFIMAILFLLGIIAGAITIKVLVPEKNDEVMFFLNSFFKAIDNNSLNSVSILKQSLFDNYKAILFMWISGTIYLGFVVSPIIILFRGFVLGFSVGFFVYEYGIKGFLFSILGIFPQNLLMIPSIISIASIAVVHSISKVKNRKIRINRNTRLTHITDYSLLVIAFSMVLFIGCLIEAYLAPIFLRFLIDFFN